MPVPENAIGRNSTKELQTSRELSNSEIRTMQAFSWEATFRKAGWGHIECGVAERREAVELGLAGVRAEQN